MGSSSRCYQIPPQFYPKVWGSTVLEPFFANAHQNKPEKTGEVWFTEPDSPLLIKFLFTTEHLSVQVHPDDRQAAEFEPGCRGKTEMWHILKAEPGAQLAMGLKRDLDPATLRRACEDGSVMEELRWIPAIPGETWYIPAGTIHAIGAGITLAEIQQCSDVTYRLFDYGRPRELHLDKGLAVSNVKLRPEPAGDRVISPYFSTYIWKLNGRRELGSGYLIVTAGSGELDGQPVRQGQVWRVFPGDVLSAEECYAIFVQEVYT